MNLDHLKNRIAIVGVGYTAQGTVPGRTAVSFHIEAIREALKDAGVDKKDIDALLLYRHFDPIGGDYDVTAFTVAEQLGINPAVVSQEYYCTRSWLYHTAGMLASGLARFVVISYGDNGKSGKRAFTKEIVNDRAADELAAYGDISTLAKYAMQARRAMETYGTGPDVWKEIAIAQRAWACKNPAALMYGKPLDDEKYESSPMMAEPFRLLDATPVTDGGRAILLTTTDIAKTLGVPYVTFRGFASANTTVSPYRLSVEDENACARVAAQKAFEMAGITPADVDALQLYDCFTYTVEATLRDYGFVTRENVRELLTRERLGPGGELPVNTSGGMLSEAYFMGLTPLAEAVLQLEGRAGERQLGTNGLGKTPEIIVCSDNGAVLQSHLAMVLENGG